MSSNGSLVSVLGMPLGLLLEFSVKMQVPLTTTMLNSTFQNKGPNHIALNNYWRRLCWLKDFNTYSIFWVKTIWCRRVINDNNIIQIPSQSTKILKNQFHLVNFCHLLMHCIKFTYIFMATTQTTHSIWHNHEGKNIFDKPSHNSHDEIHTSL